jgi:pSer/pThr/pTyr-binding forkhead associated (FHA) protein
MPTLLSHWLGPDIPLGHRSVMIGRHPECDVRLESLRVSRRHCILTSEGDAVLVRDLGSTNGTWINGRRVAVGRVRPGDDVAIAHLRYCLRSSGDSKPDSENSVVPGQQT